MSSYKSFLGKPQKAPSRFLRARTPALRQRKPQYPPSRRLSEGRRSDTRSYRAAAATTRDRQDSARPRPRTDVPREEQWDKTKETSTEKTREIQKILLLDNPEEQVSRFLALVNKDEKKSQGSQQVGALLFIC